MYVHTYFHGTDAAERAVRALLDSGFSQSDIQVRRNQYGPGEPLELETRSEATTYGVVGAICGATVGALLGVVAPGLDSLRGVFNPSAGIATLQGLLWGGAFGGAFGILSGMFRWREVVPHRRSEVDVFVGVHTDRGHAAQAASALRQSGAEQIETHGV